MRPMVITWLLLTLTPVWIRSQDMDEAIRLYRHGEYRRAAQLFSECRRLSPDGPVVRLWIAKSYLKISRWNDAVRELEQATRLSPSNSLYRLWLGRAYGEKASNSSFLTAFGTARKVGKSFAAAMELAPDDLEVRFDLMMFYARAPGIVGGGKDKARIQAEEIAKRDPRQGRTARAIILEEEKKWEPAAQELERAAIEFPLDAGSFLDLADFLFRRSNFGEAESNARKALDIDKELKGAVLIMAASKIERKKDLENAIDLLQQLGAGPLEYGEPTFEEVYLWLGRAYLAQGAKENAREAFQRSLRFNPQYSEAKKALKKAK